MGDRKQKGFDEPETSRVRRLAEIGIALSAEHDLNRLLEKIVEEARDFSGADGGTLYILNEEKECLEFAIVQNDTMNIRMGGTAGPITWPPVPLKINGKENFSNVSSYVAITGEIVNIPDVYEAKGFDFSGTRAFDARTHYRSMSMLLIPMKNKEKEIIGILQLINALDHETGHPVPFPPDNVDLIASLASQAAVAITNVRLYKDLENLFDSFIQTIATAIDEKSPYTAGHIRRVYELSMAIARKMNEQDEGPFKDFHLDENEMNELRIAAWLHDIGKITTPEHVVDKSTKLEKVFDMANLIALRYEVFKRDAKIRLLEERLNLLGYEDVSKEAFAGLDGEIDKEWSTLTEEEKFILSCNLPGEHMDEEKIRRLREIALRQPETGEPFRKKFITDDELYNLTIARGSLNPEERKIIENHALVTYKMLSKLPFPKKLRHVPEYAATHHEKLNGSGYPFGRKGEEISYPARIIAIADIFEALTAKDRPYKKAMSVSQALHILDLMRQEGHIDGDILEVFVRERIYREYADKELDPGQRDC